MVRARSSFPPMRSEPMSFMSFVRKPLVIAALGAASFAVPVGALYLAGASHAAANGAAPPPAVTTQAPPAGGASLALPDFSGMVQRYGPAVVNITVTTKVSTAWQEENGNGNGDEGDQGDNGPNGDNG